MKKIVASIVIALACSLATPIAAHASDTMSQARAGQYYLNHACKANAAQKRFYKRVWRGKRFITRAEVRRRLPAIKYESRRYGRAEHSWAVAMFNPPANWPSNVASPVNKLATINAKAASILLTTMGRASNARQWLRGNYRLNHLGWGDYAEIIRARLALPPPGEGC